MIALCQLEILETLRLLDDIFGCVWYSVTLVIPSCPAMIISAIIWAQNPGHDSAGLGNYTHLKNV